MPNNLAGRFGMQMPHLFGRYSLPDVLGRLFHRDGGDTPMQPTQYTGGLSGGSYQPYSGGLNAPDLNFHGYTGGDPMTPSTTTLNPGPGYTPADWSSYLNAPDLNIKTGNGGNGPSSAPRSTGGSSGGGMMGNGQGGGGMYTSGTLGGGSVVDPSQWGAFGLGGDSGPVNGGIGSGYALQLMSGGMHEGGMGGGALAGFLAAGRSGNTGIVPPQTGGAMPPQSPNALTGGGLAPQRMGGPQTGGSLPPSQAPTVRTGGGMQPAQMAQNRLGGNFAYGYRPGQRVR